MKLLITPDAEIDLIEIWQFIAKDNPIAATRLLSNLDQRSKSLLENPELGPKRSDIRKSYRYLVEGNYLILYQVKEETIEIIRYLHGAQNLRSL